MLAVLVLVLSAAHCRGQRKEYCSLCANHTMCVLPEVGPNCSPLITSSLTKDHANEIVNLHNKLRRKVAKGGEDLGSAGRQPEAGNMMKMQWDTELATVAQRWASQCLFENDQCRDVARFDVGQNVFMTSTSTSPQTPDWTAVVSAWYGEVGNFRRDNVKSFEFDAVSGHYSQLAWAASSALGCGFSSFQSPRFGAWFQSLYVCNYGPAGNIVAHTMYRQAGSCTGCPKGTKCNDGLCA